MDISFGAICLFFNYVDASIYHTGFKFQLFSPAGRYIKNAARSTLWMEVLNRSFPDYYSHSAFLFAAVADINCMF